MLFRSRLPNGYDPESKTVLYEVTYSGLDFTRPIAIEATSFQPQCYNFNGVYPDLTGLTDQVLPSEIGPEGQVILAKGTQPQTFPELPGLSLTMGVASDGIFHVRWWLEEGYAGRSLLAMPTSQASGENYQSEYDVHSDLTDGGDISYPALPANLVADIKSLELYGSYRGPAAAIEGEWTLENIQLEQVETKVIRDCGTYGVFVIDSIQISPLGVSVIYRNTPGDAGVFTWQHECTVHLTDGTDAIPGAPNAPWSADKTNYAFWSFENPVELDQVSALSLFGHKFTF